MSNLPILLFKKLEIFSHSQLHICFFVHVALLGKATVPGVKFKYSCRTEALRSFCCWQTGELESATHSKNCIHCNYCTHKVAHGLDLISPNFYFVRWRKMGAINSSLRISGRQWLIKETGAFLKKTLSIGKHVKYYFHVIFSYDKVKIWRNKVLTVRNFFCAIDIQLLWVCQQNISGELLFCS